MTKEDRRKTLEAVSTPEQRAEKVVAAILDASVTQEARIRSLVMIADAIGEAIAEERQTCARVLDAIKDEYIDWCAINGVSSTEQIPLSNMLSKAAASIRERARRG